MIDLYNFNVISKAVHHKYLYEIAAIPQDIRTQYLRKLEKRINSFEQKNVKLLKIIYWHIEEDEKLKWNEKKICNLLKISKNMLYVYKSKILRDLRKLYFKWNEIEEKEFKDKVHCDDYTLSFLKAEKMFTIGMKREAKTFFLKLEKQITCNKKININHKIILLKVYNYLFLLNITTNSLSYFDKLQRLVKYLMRTEYVNKNQDLKSEILTIKLNSLAYKSISNLKTKQECLEAINFFESSLKETKLINNLLLKNTIYVNTSIWLADVYLDLGDFDNAHRVIKIAIKLCKQSSFRDELILLNTLILWMKLRTGEETDLKYVIDKIESDYKSAHYFKNDATLKCKFLNRCASITSIGSDIDKISYFFYEYISAAIISNGVNSILRALYFIKFLLYFNKIKSFAILKSKSQKNYFVVTDINKKYHKRLCNTIDELLTNFNKINSIYFRHNFYCFMLETEFWKGLNCDFEKAKYIFKQISWIRSTRGKMLIDNKTVIEILNTGMLMMEEFKYMSKEKFLNKYEQTFNTLTYLLINNDAESNSYSEDVLSPYLLLSFIAEQIGYKELKQIAEELYFKLEEKCPDKFIRFLKKIEEENNSFKSILNSSSTTAA